MIPAGLGTLSLIYTANAAVVSNGAFDEDHAFYEANDVVLVPSVYDTDYSRTDLINGNIGMTTGAWAYGAAAMTDGLSGFGTAYSDGADDGGYPNAAGDYVVWNLGAGENGRGYDISSVVSIAGWNAGTFYQQYFTLAVQGVGDGSGDYTDLISVNYVPSTVTGGSSKVIIFEDASEYIATGVQYVRLTQNISGTVYREFDVFGTASSSDRGPYVSIPEHRSFTLVATLLGVSYMIFCRQK